VVQGLSPGGEWVQREYQHAAECSETGACDAARLYRARAELKPGNVTGMFTADR
jgi:hypothetical protein